MARHTFETIDPPAPLASLPARMTQSSPRLRTVLSLAALIMTALAIAAPFAAVLAHLAETPHARTLVIEQPGTVLQLAFGLVVWTVLLGWPAKRLARRLTTRRTVWITQGHVAVEETGLIGASTWTAPMPAFTGLAHHVRASVSGVRHELVLRHDDPARTVLIAVAPRFTQSEVERICGLLGVREIPARLLYERGGQEPAAAHPAFISQIA